MIMKNLNFFQFISFKKNRPLSFFWDQIIKRQRFWSNNFLKDLAGFRLTQDLIIDIDALALRKSQWLSGDELKKIQVARVGALLSGASRLSLFWRERLKNSRINLKIFDDLSLLEKIEVLEKEVIQNDLKKIVSQYKNISDCLQDHTSGSSGTPFNFYIDQSYILRSFGFCRRIFDWAGFQSGDKIVRFGIRDRHGFARDYICYPCQVAINDVAAEYERRLKDLAILGSGQKLVVFSYGSSLLKAAALATKNKIKLNLRSIIYSGDSLTQDERKTIENTFGCRLFNCYACRDVGWIAQECEKGKLHVNSEWCYVEVVDQNGRNLPNGEKGRIIVTIFDNEIMPFIRYNTGDIGTLLNKPCACGRTLPVLEFQGRTGEFLRLSDGRNFSLTDLSYFFEKWSGFVGGFQVIQKAPDFLKINLIIKTESGFDESIFNQTFSKFLGEGIRLEICYPPEIPDVGGKRKVLISLSATENDCV